MGQVRCPHLQSLGVSRSTAGNTNWLSSSPTIDLPPTTPAAVLCCPASQSYIGSTYIACCCALLSSHAALHQLASVWLFGLPSTPVLRLLQRLLQTSPACRSLRFHSCSRPRHRHRAPSPTVKDLSHVVCHPSPAACPPLSPLPPRRCSQASLLSETLERRPSPTFLQTLISSKCCDHALLFLSVQFRNCHSLWLLMIRSCMPRRWLHRHLLQPLKFYTRTPLSKRFSGEDLSYLALNFLGLCEDLMHNSSLLLDLDKIAFVRSQLVPDSRAARMMLASAFQPGLLNNSYHEFKDNFLQAFGSGQHRGGLQWVFRMTDSLADRLGTADHFDGQALAAQIADDAVSSLRKAD
ncbi:hypothetical protein GWK47_034281 [Chionoecetes opilio]|uniref:Uncharacterized protein n=1 Tax=Chionoecetes opilio TaxID=41210 RepID=A0A8J5CZZ8_CHIOP|nr:hypothetical protein GWK47_034281 [Chionoecetes opilio]